jgi:glycosyltransferase involved in cell wall biosynthesis
VIHCGVDTADFSPRPRRAPERLQLLSIGRLVPAKGFHLLIEACQQLRIMWELRIIGDGPLRAALGLHAERLGLGKQVELVGPAEETEVIRHLDSSDVLVVSSFNEGVPVVLMEAMSKELAVVATRISGIPELVEHEHTGLLVEPADPEALSQALSRLATDPELRSSLGRNARRKILAEFDIRDTAFRLREAFERYVPELGQP